MDFTTWHYLFKYSLGKKGAIKAFRQALINQNIPLEQLEVLTWRKTLKLLDNAYHNVPWYHERFNAVGMHPEDIKNREDFKNIPVLTRTELSENFAKFISKRINLRSLKISTTGGSTGRPLKIGMDGKAIREVQKWQMLSWWGLSPLADMATVYRGIPANGIKKTFLNIVRWPQKVIKADATNLTTEGIKEFIWNWNRINPRILHGYTGAIDRIADYILDNNLKVHSPEVIWLTASPVTKLIEEKVSRAFKSPICDQYGCSERYYISAECPQKQGLHIFADSVLVEIVDENNQPVRLGDYGKIILTNLDEFHFPLIRYENGDRGRLLNHQCSCGMNLPLMDKVKGRVSDNFILPDGTVLVGEYLTTIFDDYVVAVKQFQIIQHKNLDITVNYKLHQGGENGDKVIKKVKEELQKRIRGLVVLDFNAVERINQSGGKLKYIIRE
jgi:phenylacetate-CoA ligase